MTKGGKNYLAKPGEPVETVSWDEGIIQFLAWLSTLPGPVILVGHNMHTFGSRIILAETEHSQQISHLLEIMAGFADLLLALSTLCDFNTEKIAEIHDACLV